VRKKEVVVMPKVYGIGLSPFVRKVRVVLAEKSIPYELDPVIPMNVSAEYKKLSPLGKIPAYQDGSRTLCDSSVICAYLERTKPEPALYPADPYEYARALWFEEYADTALVNVAGPKVFFQRIVQPRFLNQPTDEAVVKKAIDDELPPLFDYLESQLSDAGVIAGTRFSIGDIALASQFLNLRHAGVEVDGARWPKLKKYVDNILARPSFAKLAEEERPLIGL
jgi:glutathione S-transferase